MNDNSNSSRSNPSRDSVDSEYFEAKKDMDYTIENPKFSNTEGD